MNKFLKYSREISTGIIAFSGILCISTGFILQNSYKEKPIKNESINLKVTQKQVAVSKTNKIKLKEMTSEINQPISVYVKDYLEELIDESIIKKLKLDTSSVNINEAGSYTYTVKYKKKIYNGTYIIKAKELPQLETMTLRNLTIEKGSTLSTDIATYVVETLSDEIKSNIRLNLTNINTTSAGTYQYTVTYNGKFYTGNVTVYEPQPTIKNEQKQTEDVETSKEENEQTTEKEQTELKN